MPTISQLMSAVTVRLAGKQDYPAPMAVKAKTELPRVSRADLESIYINEPTVFNAINRTVDLIMGAEHKLEGDESAVREFNEFLSGIGEIGGRFEWEELLTRIFQHQFIYGNAYVELIFNKQGTKIVDLDIIDPKKMDYAKDATGNIVLDEYGNPVGYVESVPLAAMGEALKSDKPPEKVTLTGNQIFFNPERIAHFKLYTVGDGFDGIGLIEPIYQTAVNKMDVSNALSVFFKRIGFPTRVAMVGDSLHEPTEDMLTKANEALSQADYQSSFVVPYYVKLDVLEPKRPEKIREHVIHYVNEIVTGLGMPKAFVTGIGDVSNRATLRTQAYIYRFTLKGIISRTARAIEKNIFARIAKYNGIKSIPRIVWGEISVEELGNKADRLASYVKSGIIEPDKDLEKHIRELENLPAGGAESE